jgi:anthranilate synthase component 1
VGVSEIVRALFPGGTITGCPKVRCMQIISELEQMPRSAYTGSAGYLSQNGKMDFNILIRSFIHQENTLTFRAGAVIVYDSIPNKELAETKHKAAGLVKVFNN